MNIFFLDICPRQSAQWMVDRHVVKMILESAQLLSTAHRVLDGVEIVGKSKTGRAQKTWTMRDSRELTIYKATHVNHPSAVWARTSRENYDWLYAHFVELLDEYTYRYDRKHKCGEGDLHRALSVCPSNLRDYDFTTMPSAMAPEYAISYDPVVNYRNYYKFGKAALHKWTRREPPQWIAE
jgi:hypothetical protein